MDWSFNINIHHSGEGMQVKIVTGLHTTLYLSGWQKFKIQILLKVGRDEGKEEQTLLHCWWESKLVQPFWRAIWHNLIKWRKHIFYGPAIFFLIYTPNKFSHGPYGDMYKDVPCISSQGGRELAAIWVFIPMTSRQVKCGEYIMQEQNASVNRIRLDVYKEPGWLLQTQCWEKKNVITEQRYKINASCIN